MHVSIEGFIHENDALCSQTGELVRSTIVAFRCEGDVVVPQAPGIKPRTIVDGKHVIFCVRHNQRRRRNLFSSLKRPRPNIIPLLDPYDVEMPILGLTYDCFVRLRQIWWESHFPEHSAQ